MILLQYRHRYYRNLNEALDRSLTIEDWKYKELESADPDYVEYVVEELMLERRREFMFYHSIQHNVISDLSIHACHMLLGREIPAVIYVGKEPTDFVFDEDHAFGFYLGGTWEITNDQWIFCRKQTPDDIQHKEQIICGA